MNTEICEQEREACALMHHLATAEVLLKEEDNKDEIFSCFLLCLKPFSLYLNLKLIIIILKLLIIKYVIVGKFLRLYLKQ
jgi:hypothetical protein